MGRVASGKAVVGPVRRRGGGGARLKWAAVAVTGSSGEGYGAWTVGTLSLDDVTQLPLGCRTDGVCSVYSVFKYSVRTPETPCTVGERPKTVSGKFSKMN
jgi:hypothetical protein